MPKNEFGVESSNSGGFGAGVGNDFEDMFEEAIAASVVDDEVSESKSPRRVAAVERDTFETPKVPEYPTAVAEPSLDDAPHFSDQSDSIFTQENDVDAMFAQAENASVVDDEISEVATVDPVESFDSFGSFDAEPEAVAESLNTDYNYQEDTPSFSSNAPADTASWDDPIDLEPDTSTPIEAIAPELEPVYYAPTIADPVPSVVPEVIAEAAPEPIVQPSAAPAPVYDDSSIDYIERVILTSDAIRELVEDDAKAVNMFITAGQPVISHQELVLTALLADRQIYKTAEAILVAKEKTSVDRAFYILGLDDETFADFGKILSHDLESTETVIFEGDRLQYARKLVDVVESLPAVSIKRFEAVKSVLGAGESVN